MSAGEPQRDIRKPVLDLVTESYVRGPDSLSLPVWPSGPHDEAWTAEEAATALHFALSLFIVLAWEVDAAQIKGRDVSIAEHLQMYQLMLKLAESGDPVAELARIAAATGHPIQDQTG